MGVIVSFWSLFLWMISIRKNDTPRIFCLLAGWLCLIRENVRNNVIESCYVHAG